MGGYEAVKKRLREDLPGQPALLSDRRRCVPAPFQVEHLERADVDATAAGKPFRSAGTAFRWSEDLKPWSMAEIFILGCAVALVKVTELAQVVFGPAFWLFVVLVIVTVFQDGLLNRWSIWQSLEQKRSH